MVILDVIPLIPLPRSQPAVASYFHTDPLPHGTVVQVAYSNRKIKAVVVECVPLADRKLQFKKQASFTLKKIDKVLKQRVTDEQIKKARELAEYYFAPLGLCMRAVFLHPDEREYKKYISTGPFLDLPELSALIPKTYNLKPRIADMRKEIRDANYSIFSRYLKEALQTYDKLIIFIPRKGYANFLLCKDCGTGIKCPNCDVSLTQHQGPTLMCHHCNFTQPQPKTCPSCKSYNLKPYGVGIEKVEAELIKFFSYQNLAKPKIVQLTSDSRKLPEDFQILLTTQSLFKYRDLLKVPYLAIMNADALIHIPDYRAEEMLLRQTLLLASMTDHLLVQTYNPEDPALVAAAHGRVDEFWASELEQRKAFGYPPFVKLIKLTYRNRDARITKHVASEMATKLSGTAYPALISRERGMYVWNVLLKLTGQMSDVKGQLLALPPDWQIDVDPISIV